MIAHVGIYHEHESKKDKEYCEVDDAIYAKGIVSYAEFYISDNIWISVEYDKNGNPISIKLWSKNLSGIVNSKTIQP